MDFVACFSTNQTKFLRNFIRRIRGEHRDYGLYLSERSDIINIGIVCVKVICKGLDKKTGRGAAAAKEACRVKKKGWFSVLQNLSWLTQLGLSLAVPPVLCLLGAGWLVRRFALGPWVYFAAMLLGLGAAACTFAEFVKMFRRKNGKK